MMRALSALTLALVSAYAGVLLSAQGQGPAHSVVLVPDSSIEHPGEQGLRAHTNHLIRVDPNAVGTSPSGETPASLRAIYNLPSTGGANTIAIVDAFDYPSALVDFNTFSRQFGLPQETSTNALASTNSVFQVVYASGKQPRGNCGWAQEAALDIEWAHAMAPGAKIVLVEAASNSFANLLAAVDAAATLPGAKEISMSWGGSEFSGESGYDSHFLASGVVYFAASGDTGGATIYPAASPYVVSAGGTTVNRNSSGAFVSETAWGGSGGGPSQYEPRPGYQDVIAGITGSARGIPDYSFDANPNTGVSVYDTTPCKGMSGWMVFGGTSVSSPSLAGVVNLAGKWSASSGGELNLIYGNMGNASDFRDITSGSAGSYKAVGGWDFVTGVGSNQGLSGK